VAVERDERALPPGVCVHCGGLGVVPEKVDDDLLDEMVPCFWCRRYCKACGQWVQKSGHECKGVT
jgi:hypothetical protein